MKNISRQLISVLALLFIVTVSAEAVRPVRIDTTTTHLIIPRPALEPVKSLITSPSDVIDTLDTANEHIKVILRADNTWSYYKTPDFQQVAGVFDDHWNETQTNPYGIEQADQ